MNTLKIKPQVAQTIATQLQNKGYDVSICRSLFSRNVVNRIDVTFVNNNSKHSITDISDTIKPYIKNYNIIYRGIDSYMSRASIKAVQSE